MEKPTSDREAIDVLAAEFVARHRQGETPSMDEYAERNPELAEEIYAIFPTIVAIEKLKVHKEQSSSGGRASLGAVRPESLGDFRIIREVGRGGMGIVYEAEQESLGRKVAVKVLPRQSLLQEKQLIRFQQEARTAAQLHHTNIVPVFGVGQSEGFHFYAMQFIDGVGLDEIMARLTEGGHGMVTGVAAIQPSIDKSAGSDSRINNVDQLIQALLSNRFVITDNTQQSKTGPVVEEQNVKLPDITEAMDVRTQALPKTESLSREPSSNSINTTTPKLSFPTQYWQAVAGLGIQAADALHYAHTQGTLHRDIKPANLLLDKQGVLWIADFGLARAIASERTDRGSELVGTLRYMAPEQLRGHSDARSDICSLGLTLYELMALQPAYQDTDRNSLIAKIKEKNPENPSKWIPDVPSDLEAIVFKAVARNSENRYFSAGELADDLRRYLADRPVHARRTSVVGHLKRWYRRNRAVAALSVLSIVLLLVVAIGASIGFVVTNDALNGESVQRQKAETALYGESVQRQKAEVALNGESVQRQKAEETATIALEAFDNFYQSFVPERSVVQEDLTVEDPEDAEFELPVQGSVSKETASLLEGMLVYYDRLAMQNTETSIFLEATARANRRVGDMRQRLMQYSQAEASYRKSLYLYDQLLNDSSEKQGYLLEMVSLHNRLGEMFRAMEDLPLALEQHWESLQLLESLGAETLQSDAMRYELARTYFNLAPRRRELGLRGRRLRSSNPSGLASRENTRRLALDKAIELLESLVKDQPSVADYRYLLVQCYQAVPWRRGTDREKVFDRRNRATVMLEELVQQFPDTADYRYLLSRTLAQPSRRLERLGDSEKQELSDHRMRALSMARLLMIDHPGDPRYRAWFARNCQLVAVGLSLMGKWDGAQSHYREAHNQVTRLVSEYSDNRGYRYLHWVLNKQFAGELYRNGKSEESRDLIEKEIASLENWEMQGTDQALSVFQQQRMFLAGSFLTLARLCKELGDETAARNSENRAESLFENEIVRRELMENMWARWFE
jgi:serine/threonine protein kinase